MKSLNIYIYYTYTRNRLENGSSSSLGGSPQKEGGHACEISQSAGITVFFFLLGEGCPRRAIAEDVGQDKVIETKLTRHPVPAGTLSGHWIDQLPT